MPALICKKCRYRAACRSIDDITAEFLLRRFHGAMMRSAQGCREPPHIYGFSDKLYFKRIAMPALYGVITLRRRRSRLL